MGASANSSFEVNTMTLRVFIILIFSALIFMTTNNCLAQTQTAAPAPAPPHDHSHMTKTTKESSPAANYFSDVQLINQDGKPVRFYSDVLKGKSVVTSSSSRSLSIRRLIRLRG